jgi:hypothetical protein
MQRIHSMEAVLEAAAPAAIDHDGDNTAVGQPAVMVETSNPSR